MLSFNNLLDLVGIEFYIVEWVKDVIKFYISWKGRYKLFVVIEVVIFNFKLNVRFK